MGARHRLYVPAPIAPDQPLELPHERAHYLTRVLRLRRGETIEIFDGQGKAWAAVLTAASSRSATLAVGRLVADEPDPQPRLHLVQGLLKGASMDLVVQKATELGATDLWPILAARSNVPTERERHKRRAEHWRKVIESTAEQCGALYLTRLHDLCLLGELLTRPPASTLLLIDPGAPPLPVALPKDDVCMLIGPEGGWNAEERRAAAAAGAHRFGLGTRILRAETAPLAVLAAVRHGWGWS